MAQTGLVERISCKSDSASLNKCNVTHDMSKTMNNKQTRNKIKRIVKERNPNAFHVFVQLYDKDATNPVPAVAQIDSGCTRSMINRSFAKAAGLTIQPLKRPLEVEGCNHTLLDHVDGRVQLQLSIGHHKEIITLWTMNLTDDADLLLGYDWLLCHNPQIDWENGTFTLEKCPLLCIRPVRQAANQCLGIWDQ